MEAIERITTWVTENEALLSGLAALIAIVAIVPAVLAPMRRLRAREGERPSAPRRTGSEADGPPRIAVFPFASADGAPETQTESELLQRELTTLLARGDGCEVISSAAAQAFAVEGGTSSEAGQALAVDYVVEGEVRATGEGFRVTASLIDTETQRVAWSDVFSVSASDEPDLSVRLAERVAAHLGIEIMRTEVGRARTRPRSRQSRDLMLQAQGLLFSEGHHKATYERAIELLDKATTRTPDFAEAYGLMALLYALGAVFGFFERTEVFKQKVFAICQKAIELDDRSSEVLGFVGCAYCDLRQFEKGMPLLDRAVSHNPSNAQAKAALGAALNGLGRFEESVACLDEALALSPAYKGIAPWATVLANSQLELGRRKEASEALDQAIRCDPSFYPAQLTAARIASLEGDAAAAGRHFEEARRLQPGLDAILERHGSAAAERPDGEPPMIDTLSKVVYPLHPGRNEPGHE